MAQAVGRLTGTPGVVAVTSGPVSGDGGFLMSAMELETAHRLAARSRACSCATTP
jgi:thiamine pyrophosphate-dependent acetolactate synthase large subunit-like protein